MRRRVKKLRNMGQRSLGFAHPEREGGREYRAVSDHRFVDDDPRDLRVGEERLDAYLTSIDLGWVIRLRRLLDELDYGLLTRAYEMRGRKAIHPRVMLGLMVYGMLMRQWSLRDLELLARRDTGAWWICGGGQPDHSTIGKFIQLHGAVLSGEFFVALVRFLVGRLRLPAGTVAADGTVVEAAAGHYQRLKLEAAELAADQARQAAAAEPTNQDLVERAERAQVVLEAAMQRQAAQQAHGRAGSDGAVDVVVGEAQAVVQPGKDGRLRPAYKPSILVHEAGLIVGQHVHPTNETASVAPMLEHHRAIFGAPPRSLLLDAGYAGIALFEQMVAQDIDLLCPTGKATREENWEKTEHGGRFAKSAFHYQAASDEYHCPAGQRLRYADSGENPRGGHYRRYRGQVCAGCELRSRCTTDRHGRTIKRYAGEEVKEAMVAVLQQPRARAKYRQRSVLAEPPFAELRERQGLKRFRRRGLAGVQVEFALHCIAFDLKKVLRHPAYLLVFILSCRIGHIWKLRAVGTRFVDFRRP
jgi:transposase